jgi:anaerobic magnesium-protoporphyrin IX monomethyl ester cyclase
MKKNTVVFITVSDYDNLGVGYMAALLTEAGFKTRIIDFRVRKSDLLKKMKNLDPLLIGFSVVFLSYIKQFIEIIAYLSNGGIKCHFTAGGHYASLKYEELFKMAPGLDSIIRFEGEYPILELARKLTADQDWKSINSLTFIENAKIITNPIWPHEKDIDKFPFPSRSSFKKYAFQKKFTVILAGRGCVHNCSFCNTREFYRQASCPVKRIRKPELVVSEMNYLYHNKGCSVFLFHDDDFPVKSQMQNDWIVRFCEELEKTGLNKKIIWKINCRPDEIEEESFFLMKRNGLFLVFLGLEDGTDAGLKRLNKQMTVEKSVSGMKILKKLKIGFDYGFMLFQPSTTFKSLNENLKFLRQICGDGYTPVTFLKLIPLYETRVEKELIKSGRFYISEGIGDYDFPEESMNRYYSFIIDCFTEWLRDREGVENISKWARNYLAVYKHYYNDRPGEANYCRRIRRIISQSNLFLLDNMKELSEIFKTDRDKDDKNLLLTYKKKISAKHNYYKNEIINSMVKLLSHVEDQKIKTYA